ncbi:MAG: plastocyanin [Methanomassiliicoccales archaeon PtaU1.Bin124]|nr:MAG: plastocyanin [Methanomassiliicoccales archaeon PtaU1.Bin124]
MKTSGALIIVAVIVIIVVMIAVATLLGPKGGGGNTTPSETNDVSITSGFTFSPSTLTIHAGQNVTWTNDASIDHSVVSDSGNGESFSSGVLGHGQSYTHRFMTVGNFTYHCSLHTYMTGTIVVLP